MQRSDNKDGKLSWRYWGWQFNLREEYFLTEYRAAYAYSRWR